MSLVSIIIRTFNEQKHIWNLLQTLRKQEERDFEIILVDSGSTDATIKIAEGLCDKILQIQSRDFTFGYSLNVGCKEAKGEYLVFVSAHAIPLSTRWIDRLIAPLSADQQVAMTYGRHIGAETTKFSEKRDFARLFPPTSVEARRPYPYYAINANSAIRRTLWQIHPFDENLAGLEDMAWGKHYTEQGMKVVYVPEAAVSHIHEEHWGQVYNRYRREAAAAKMIGVSHPPHGHPAVQHFIKDVIEDFIAGFPRLSLSQLHEITRYRYQQWRGTRDGWRHNLDLDKERFSFYYSGANSGVVIEGVRQAGIKDMPIPEMKPSDVLIKVAYTGVCATDVEVYEGSLGYYQQGIAQYPITPGHEFSGTVVRVGANVKDLNVGEKVVGECVLSCRQCAYCDSGSYAACKERKEVGVMNYHGSYAQFIVLPAMYVHKIPEGMDLKIAALAEPLAVVLRGLRRLGSRLKPQSNCAVVGAGPIGNLTAQVLVKYGHQVTVFNRREGRLRHLKQMMQVSSTLSGLEQFDVIVEASGNPEALSAVLAQSRTDVTILLLGFPYASMDYNFEQLVGQEKVIVGSVGGTREDFEAALTLLPTLMTDPFTQAIFPLRDFQKAWETHRSADQLKVMIESDGLGHVSAGAVSI